jgi:hypothetical protein
MVRGGGGLQAKHKEDSIMSQLVEQFKKGVDAFNRAQIATDYANLQNFYHPDVKMNEVNPPHKAHPGRLKVIAYLQTQVDRLPRFWPDYTQLDEPPNSDDLVQATFSGPAMYQDASIPPTGPTPPVPVNYYFEAERKTINDDWVFKFASAK